MLNKSKFKFKNHKQRLQVPLVSIPFESQSLDNAYLHIYDKILRTVDQIAEDQLDQAIRKKHKWTQTDFRDSETQTIPWEAPFIMKSGSDTDFPILQLSNLTWNHGLPVGPCEIEMINAVLETTELKKNIPPIDSKHNFYLASKIIAASEAIEWAYREKEIQCILDIRMRLYEKLTWAKNLNSDKKFNDRLRKMDEYINHRRNKTIDTIKQKFNRELRKLRTKYIKQSNFHGATQAVTYGIPNITYVSDQHKRNSFIHMDDDFEEFGALTTKKGLTYPLKKSKTDNLCVKYTKWNEQKLKKLYEELRDVRLNDHTLISLKEKLKSDVLSQLPSSRVEVNNQSEKVTEKENMHPSLNDESSDQMKTTFLQEFIREQKEKRTQELLDMLEEVNASDMLDFLDKKLNEVYDEHRIHACALLASKTKKIKEVINAEEVEEEIDWTRQEELGNIFIEIMQNDRKSVTEFLDKVMKENEELVSKEEIKRYVLEILDKIDTVQGYLTERSDDYEDTCTNMLTDNVEYADKKASVNVYDDVFNLLNNENKDNIKDNNREDSGEHSFTEEYWDFTERTGTLDENSHTWETFEESFEETFDQINEPYDTDNYILNNILSNNEQIDEAHQIVSEILNELLSSVIDNSM